MPFVDCRARVQMHKVLHDEDMDASEKSARIREMQHMFSRKEALAEAKARLIMSSQRSAALCAG